MQRLVIVTPPPPKYITEHGCPPPPRARGVMCSHRYRVVTLGGGHYLAVQSALRCFGEYNCIEWNIFQMQVAFEVTEVNCVTCTILGWGGGGGFVALFGFGNMNMEGGGGSRGFFFDNYSKIINIRNYVKL